MTTERTSEFSGKCPCGKGTLEITCCSDDNGYTVYPDYYESLVACGVCKTAYVIEKVGKAFHLAHKGDVDKITSKNEEFHSAAEKLRSAAESIGIMSAFADLLDALPSAAARHRTVTYAGIERSAIATFRNRWRGGKVYAQINSSGHNVGRILKIIKNSDPSLLAAVAQLEALGHEARGRPPVIHPPFYTLD